MITSVIRARVLFSSARLDARYSVEGVEGLRDRLSNSTKGECIATMGTATMPTRLKKMPATPAEDSVPYLRPYDVFEYLPPESDRLSQERTKDINLYLIHPGDILQTRSGRNLGPVTLADNYLARFAVSDDLVRVRLTDQTQRFYTYAFLRSATGQRVLRGDRGGSVISHISPQQVGAIEVPFVESIVGAVVGLVGRATELREAARTILHAAVEGVATAYPKPTSAGSRGWTSPSSRLTDRFDAAYHSHQVAEARSSLHASGGLRLGDVATVLKPGGRHRMVYVAAGQGSPLLSGRQILQCEPVAMKYLSPHAAHAAADFALKAGSVIFQADGRAEEGLGYPALVTADRDGWLASGHVGRAIPKVPADAGWLWTSLASDVVRTQVTALSTGSVVDALYPEDLEDVVLPRRDLVDSIAVMHAWADMGESSKLLDQASALVDEALGETL